MFFFLFQFPQKNTRVVCWNKRRRCRMCCVRELNLLYVTLRLIKSRCVRCTIHFGKVTSMKNKAFDVYKDELLNNMLSNVNSILVHSSLPFFLLMENLLLKKPIPSYND